MDTRLTLIVLLVVLVLGLAVNLYYQRVLRNDAPVVTSFEECVAAGNPILESYPRSCTTDDGATFTEVLAEEPSPESNLMEPTLTLLEAQELAQGALACTSEGAIGAFESFNPNSGTWWFTLSASRPGCSPACVVTDATRGVEVNWRCTGLLSE